MHFDEMTCLLYLDGQLDPARAAELAAHADSCAGCRALLAALERESRLLRGALVEEDEAVPARLLAPPARETTSWAWIASLGFAAAGAYTLWTGFIEPLRQQLSLAGFGDQNLLAMLFFGGIFWKGWEEMQNIVQFLAITTLGILALSLLGRTWRRWTTIAVVMGGLIAMLALPPAAAAAEIHKKESYTLPAGETVKNDLIVTARTTRIDGTVEGDLIAFTESLTMTGRVTGDVIAFAQRVRIDGQVDGNVRSFAHSLSLTGSVAKNITAFQENLDLDSKSQVGGSVTAGYASGNLDGRVARDLLLFAARTQLNGFVGGGVRLRGERLIIGPTAEIQGQASFRGRHQPEVSPQAKLASPLDVQIVKHRPDYSSPRFYWRQALKWGAAFLFGLVAILLMPDFFRETLRSSRRFGASLGYGALALVATPILAIIACVTIVGLPVGIGAVLLYVIALYAAQVFVGAAVGQKLLGEADATGAMLGRLAVGLLLIHVVGKVPHLGGLVWLLVLLLGLGALTLAIYNRMRSQPPAAA